MNKMRAHIQELEKQMEESGSLAEMIDAEAMIQESEPSMGILEEKNMTK